MKSPPGTVEGMPEAVATHCPYCALQCAMTLRRGEGGIEVEPGAGEGGGLCRKGWTAADLLTSPERLTTPLIRSPDGVLEPATWDQALDLITRAVRHLQQTYGPDAVAVLGGGGLTNEKAYALGKFARVVLGTSRIDYNGRFCMSSAAAASIRAFGLDRGLPFPMSDIGDANAVLLVGSNAAETMPPFVRHLTRLRDSGGALIVVDPRATPTAREATLHLQVTPGTDLALALGLVHTAIVEGRLDRRYIEERTTGFDAVRRIAMAYWPERVERITGVPVALQREAVRLLADADRAIVLTARGAEQHADGTDTVSAFVNLALALGLPGTQGSGYGCLTGQGNGQGGREHGQKADQLPGYRRLDDPEARAHVARVWGVDPDSLPQPGPSAYELLESLGRPDGPRALLVFGTNPVVSAPAAGRIAERLDALDLLVVSDLFLSETAALADIVLPAAQWAEEDGTMTNLEGRVVRRRRLLAPPGEARSDLAILAGLAERLGHDDRISADPEAVFGELGLASAGGAADYSGMSYERLEAEDGLYWPCPALDHPGTPRLFLDRFATPDGRARFVPVDHRPVAEQVDDRFPLYLTTGRVLSQYQSGTQTRRVPALTKVEPHPFVELHPDLAEREGIADGEEVRVVSRRGSAVAPARLTDTIRIDTLFMPFHWSGAGRANSVTDPTLDPVSRMPSFKVCAARLEKVA